MPSWQTGAYLGVKIMTISPDNSRRALPAIQGQYLLFDAPTGVPLALMDGKALTNVRTAAASLLAAQYLAPPAAKTYLIAGTGDLVDDYARAFAGAFPLEKIMIWGRSPAKASRKRAVLSDLSCRVEVVSELAAAQQEADIISTLTLARAPILFVDHARPGQHYDLVGAYKPDRREVDGELLAASRLFVDTHFGGLHEAGDIVLAIEKEQLSPDAILGDLAGLYQAQITGRQSADDITVFKSVGHASEDLAAATLLYERSQ